MAVELQLQTESGRSPQGGLGAQEPQDRVPSTVVRGGRQTTQTGYPAAAIDGREAVLRGCARRHRKDARRCTNSSGDITRWVVLSRPGVSSSSSTCPPALPCTRSSETAGRDVAAKLLQPPAVVRHMDAALSSKRAEGLGAMPVLACLSSGPSRGGSQPLRAAVGPFATVAFSYFDRLAHPSQRSASIG